MSRKVAEIHRNPRVTLYYFDRENEAYVTIKGVARLVNEASSEELATIFWELGGEHASRRIARLIEREREVRPFESTRQLGDLIERGVHGGRWFTDSKSAGTLPLFVLEPAS